MQSEGLIAVANPAATAEDARIGRDGADAAESLAGPDSHGVAETLRQIAGIGRRNLRPMLGIVALALVAAAVLTLLTTRAYTAIASVQVNDQSAQVLGKAFEGENEAIPASDTERFLNTQLEILNSRGIAQRVARRLGLERLRGPAGGRGAPHPVRHHLYRAVPPTPGLTMERLTRPPHYSGRAPIFGRPSPSHEGHRQCA